MKYRIDLPEENLIAAFQSVKWSIDGKLYIFFLFLPSKYRSITVFLIKDTMKLSADIK